MADKNGKCPGCKKNKCDGCSLYPGRSFQTGKNTVIPFPTDFVFEPKPGYGIALDLGTTTVAASLWNLKEGSCLSVKTCVNPQRFAGSDVVSRLLYCGQHRENKEKLRKALIAELDRLGEKLCAAAGNETGREPSDFRRQMKIVTVAGNTAMGEIFFDLPLEGLLAAPFEKSYHGCLRKRGRELGFSFLGETDFILLPAIQGFAGADALCVYTWIKKSRPFGTVLAVDIGTNGEILLIDEKNSFVCSAAAGPALEGAAVSQGMWAAPGAIEEVGVLGSFPRQDLFCRTIGDGKPAGICGSGLIDALAVLKKMKVMDETGYLFTKREAAERGVPPAICNRLESDETGNRILLTNAESPVYLTGSDIRQLQLSKAAIRAGAEILLSKAEKTEKELNCLYLAGAFGSYIKPESALAAGLLPDIPKEKVVSIGNCATAGAAMALLSENLLREMERCSEQIRHAELAEEKNFQRIFLESMKI